MDESETLVREYLEGLGHQPIFEPDGNVPPDFVLEDGKTAIEVRRLNENYASGGSTEGLEATWFPLWQRMARLLTSFGGPDDGVSYYVTYKFRRPLDWGITKPKIIDALASISKRSIVSTERIQVTDNFGLDFIKSPEPQAEKFMLVGVIDIDSGGWTVDEFVTNLTLCVDEKSAKIAPYRSRYDHWWLCLVSHIGFGFEETMEQVRTSCQRPASWQRIIVIDPNSIDRKLEF